MTGGATLLPRPGDSAGPPSAPSDGSPGRFGRFGRLGRLGRLSRLGPLGRLRRPVSAPWRTPPGDPRYARPALLAIMAVAAVLFCWDMRHSGYHAFYAETAHSMAMSWKGFFFGSFDPGNTITIDKVPGFLWPQALSVRLFGFHGWALTLPQAIEGVLSVAVLHRAVRRWAGVHAALLAAAAFTLTPVIAGMFRTQVEDPSFTLLVLLAADATLKAAVGARVRPLLAAGFWVGLAFQAKMLEAWAVLPALGLLYAVSAPAVLRRRLAHLVAAGAVCLAVSATWVLAVTLTPAHDRPYVDGTTDNSAVSQVVGYNFLSRFASLGVTAKDTGSVSDSVMVGTTPTGHPGTGHGTQGPAQWAKMFGKSLSSQTGWLYPAALISAVCGVVRRRGRPRTDPLRAGFLLWSAWLATYFAIFSAGAVGEHTYYMGVVAVPLAALFGAGTVELWRSWKRGGRVGLWGLPALVVGTVGWSAVVAGRFPGFLPWLVPVASAGGAVGLGLLAVARGGVGAGAAGGARGGVWGSGRPDGFRRRTAVVGLGVVLVAMLLPSGAWASSVLDARYGHSGMGTAGPVLAGARRGAARETGLHRGGGPGMVVRRRSGVRSGVGGRTAAGVASGEAGFGANGADAGLRGGHGWTSAGTSADGRLSPEEQRVLAYTRAHQGGAPFLFLTLSWRAAPRHRSTADTARPPASSA
ncbi:ArnT family glycosyltransferase [Actinacidiphila rubida]|uniref:ArnT family glycosyltransferase n=1 Tax=Actinacidiphila rubida TaxID=310780 RepID=UPI000849D6D6|nr:glycosyltransferase family 39 protein [Actinacidiphila rubida]